MNEQLTKREQVALEMFKDLMASVRGGGLYRKHEHIEQAAPQNVIIWAFEDADKFLAHSASSTHIEKEAD